MLIDARVSRGCHSYCSLLFWNRADKPETWTCRRLGDQPDAQDAIMLASNSPVVHELLTYPREVGKKPSDESESHTV